ncbi:hypothetical protein F4779DRAFT_5409 [Xylariaceae sp. FL0662B]|nr:hypothetical protein F4779DRAFT_5409 [Xylariaceae sp. FL0662B]
MCKGNQTQMSCGHTLTHFSERCGRKCAIPEGPLSYLSDSCARCDSGYLTHVVTKDYRERREELLGHFWGNKRDERMEDVRKNIERLEILNRSTNKALGEAKHLAFSAVDVEFPDKFEQKGMTSKWINGKCVWVDEEDPASVIAKKHGIPMKKNTRSADKDTAGAEPPLITGPPRLRKSNKKYKDPFENIPVVEHRVITGPPRFSRKPSPGPRDQVVFREEESPASAQTHSFRGSNKSFRNRLAADGHSSHAGLESSAVRNPGSRDQGSDSDRTIRAPTRSRKTESSTDYDIWMQIYDDDPKDKGERRAV